MSKKDWRERWLDSIYELTSLNLQKEKWLNLENTNPHWSFIEFLECYFSDLFLDDNYQDALETKYVSIEEFEILKNWHTKLANYISPNNDDYNHSEILADKNWIEIVEIGNDAKHKLIKIVNPEEENILVNGMNAA